MCLFVLYLFDEDGGMIDCVMCEMILGGVLINEMLMYIVCGSLLFGGVGVSGMGVYYGYDGFVMFLKMKLVFM